MDKNSYALGMSIAHNMLSSGIKEVDFEDFTAGIKAVLKGEEPAVSSTSISLTSRLSRRQRKRPWEPQCVRKVRLSSR